MIRNCSWCNSPFDNSVYGFYCSMKCVNEVCDRESQSRARIASAYDAENKERSLKDEIFFYSRECSQCAETVKRKAKVCKECGFEFSDNQEQIEYLNFWEERAAKFDLKPWQMKEIEQEEFNLTPEGKQRIAEQERLKREQEEKEEKEREPKQQIERAEEQLNLLQIVWVLFVVISVFGELVLVFSEPKPGLDAIDSLIQFHFVRWGFPLVIFLFSWFVYRQIDETKRRLDEYRNFK